MSLIPDLFLPTEIPAPPIIQDLGYTMKEMSIVSSATGKPGVFAIVLAVKDENGAWREDIPTKLFRKDDVIPKMITVSKPKVGGAPGEVEYVQELEVLAPEVQYAASMFQSIMLNAIIDPTNNETAAFIGLAESLGKTVPANLTVKNLSKILLPLLLDK